MRPRHAHHIELARCNRMARRRDILNSGGMKGGHAGAGTDFTCKIQMWRARHTLDGDDIDESGIGFDMPANDVEKINKPAFLELARNLEPIAFRQTTLENFIGNVANSDQEVRPNTLTNCSQNLQREPHTIIERATVNSVEFVGKRGPELVQQMPVGFQLQPVETGCLHAFRCIRIIHDNALNVPILCFLGIGAMGWLVLARRGQ